MRLPTAELLLLDWLLCGQGEKAAGQLLDDLSRWNPLRERIWRSIIESQWTDDKTGTLEIEDYRALELMALVPTTFKWGTGEDVGFTLKNRLADLLWGEEERERHEGLMKVRAMLNKELDSAEPDHTGDDSGKDHPPNAAQSWADD